MCTVVATLGVTVDVERFAGANLNICSFNPIEAFVEILLCCLGQKCLLFSVTTEGLYSQKNFTVLLKIMKPRKLSQSIFPWLQYSDHELLL